MRVTASIGVLLVAALVCFVPWHAPLRPLTSTAHTYSWAMGADWFWSMPSGEDGAGPIRVDVTRLLLVLLAAGIVVASIGAIAGGAKSSKAGIAALAILGALPLLFPVRIVERGMKSGFADAGVIDGPRFVYSRFSGIRDSLEHRNGMMSRARVEFTWAVIASLIGLALGYTIMSLLPRNAAQATTQQTGEQPRPGEPPSADPHAFGQDRV